MKFYDSHTHFIGQEHGGILVGLEGEPWFEENSPAFCVQGKILHNDEAAAIAAAKGGYLFFRYVTRGEVRGVLSAQCLVPGGEGVRSAQCLVPSEREGGWGMGDECRVQSAECSVQSAGERAREVGWGMRDEGKGEESLYTSTRLNQFLKFHPRREGYTPEDVIGAIGRMRPKAVMIDTLNEPGWVAYDYWKVCRAYPEITFLLPHAGGYQINEFVKICHFQRNVWIDFTLTHTNFGGISKNPLPYVDQAIWYALNAPFRERVLMGSDLPFFNQMDVVGYYERLGKLEMLNDNFERLYENLTCKAQ